MDVPAGRSGLRALLVPALLVAGVLLPFLPVLAGGEAFVFPDAAFYYHPLKQFSLERLAEGTLPGWNPWTYAGTPHLANPTLGTFYPLNVLLLAGDYTASLGAFLALHAALAALFTWRLLRGLLPGRVAGPAAAALGFALGGPFLSYTANPFYLLSWAWAPFVLDCGFRMEGRGVRGALAAGAGLAMQFLAGDPQAAFLTGLLLAAQQMALSPWKEPLRGTAPRLLLRVGLPALLLLGLTAMQWLPAAEFLSLSTRGEGMDPAERLRWSFHPVRALGFLFPWFFGRFLPENSFWGYPWSCEHNQFQFWFFSVYVGVLPFLGALAALLTPGRRRIKAFLAMGGLALGILAAGEHLPGVGAFLSHTPGFDLFRYPEKHLIGAMLLLSVLGGIGLEDLLDGASRRRDRAVLSAAALVAALATALALAAGPMRAWIEASTVIDNLDAAWTETRWSLLHGALAAGTGGILLAVRGRLRRGVAGAALVALLFADVLVAGRAALWTVDRGYFSLPVPAADLLAAENREGGGYRYHRDGSLDSVLMHRDREGFLANAVMLRLRLWGNQAPLERHLLALKGYSGAFFSGVAALEPGFVRSFRRLAPILSVRWLLVHMGEAPRWILGLLERREARVVQEDFDTGMAVLEVAFSLPILRLAYAA
ncbi:MAG: hypothetical protein FJ098_02835, partial [Deltaproteobacteria bacterium]|nr:hypothetical protein [Deltaproteobacteria bacterium]